KESDLQVEQDEQDRDEVVADVEFHAGVFEGLEATFVGRQLFGVGTIRGNDPADGQQRHSDPDADENEEQDRKVLFQHRMDPTPVNRSFGGPCLRSADCLPPRSLRATLVGAASRFLGADGETRTHTAYATAPSRQRVYQFHHVGGYFGTSPAFESGVPAGAGAAGAPEDAGAVPCGTSLALLSLASFASLAASGTFCMTPCFIRSFGARVDA